MKRTVFTLCLLGLFVSCTHTPPPEACGPVPTERQLQWHQMEMYAFIHFSMNTFTGMEWGYGDNDPSLFNPSAMDCRQWARICKEAGMKGIVLTAKHHDGFCLWQTKYTDYSVKQSPWKDGHGDVVAELSQACKEYGLKFGVYLSPWDRNSSVYGTPEYITYYRNQLTELLTQYGDIFEIWFDGANGGDGYYGGARETRKIDNRTYYDWSTTHQLVRDLQPNACIFSDSGPDCRWVGNEQGWAGETNWCTLRMKEFWPGGGGTKILPYGMEDGENWVPAEVDVSTRPGWFYHERTDTLVKSPQRLLEIYYSSVGRNANLILNIPVDKRGLVHENEEVSLLEFGRLLREEFKNDLAQGKTVTAENVRGNDSYYAAKNVLSDDDSYWATDDGVTTSTLLIDLGAPTKINKVVLQEAIALGQRVQSFDVEGMVDGEWRCLSEGTTIGNKRILRFNEVNASQVRINFTKAKASLAIKRVAIY